MLETIKRGSDFLRICITKKLDKTSNYHFLRWTFKEIRYFKNKSKLFVLLLKSVLKLLYFNYFLLKGIQKKKKQSKTNSDSAALRN